MINVIDFCEWVIARSTPDAIEELEEFKSEYPITELHSLSTWKDKLVKHDLAWIKENSDA